MEHLNTLIVSVLLAGIISFFPTIFATNNDTKTPRINLAGNDSSKFIAIKQKPRSTTNPEAIFSWLELSDTNDQGIPSQVESCGNHEALSIKIAKQLIILDMPENSTPFTTKKADRIVLKTPNYWEVVHSIESKQGKRMYRPRNKERSCEKTNSPCGHYQISAQALKDIGCTSNQCKINRENLKQSLEMSMSLEKKNLNRLAEKGYSHLPDFQKYLIHQQGATGIRLILAAQEGRYELGDRITKNMANNSSFSYTSLKNSGSKLAAKKFLNYWEKKWEAEIELIFANQLKEQMALREYLTIAANIKF